MFSKNKNRILSYESWCGGVPCPDVCDNPLGYKFSWSPLAALNALKNEALFLFEGKVKKLIKGIKEETL